MHRLLDVDPYGVVHIQSRFGARPASKSSLRTLHVSGEAQPPPNSVPSKHNICTMKAQSVCACATVAGRETPGGLDSRLLRGRSVPAAG